jgi:hypothetical protein
MDVLRVPPPAPHSSSVDATSNPWCARSFRQWDAT